MVARRSPVADEWATPLTGYLIGFLTLTGGIFLVLYSLLKPAVVANPGLKAYSPPPATLLIAAPRKMDAPELAESLHALAQDYPVGAQVETPPKPAEVQRPVRKRERATVRREHREEPFSGFAAGWNWNGGYNRQSEQRQYDYRAYGYRQYDYRRSDTQRQTDRRSWW